MFTLGKKYNPIQMVGYSISISHTSYALFKTVNVIKIETQKHPATSSLKYATDLLFINLKMAKLVYDTLFEITRYVSHQHQLITILMFMSSLC